MKSHLIFYKPLATIEDAKTLLTYLVDNGLSYHCEDDAHDCIGHIVGEGAANALNARMKECYTFDWGGDNCPCAFLLELDPEYLGNAINNRDEDMGSILRVADDHGMDIDHENYREIWADKVRLENLLADRETTNLATA